MPHHDQFKKSLRKEAKRREANRSQRARLRHSLRVFKQANDAETAEKCMSETASLLDKGAKVHLIHPGKASRLKARMAAAVNRLRAQA
jgi:small subunit ribosomal protein S20